MAKNNIPRNPLIIAPGLAQSPAYVVCHACDLMTERINHNARKLGLNDHKNLWLLIAIADGKGVLSQGTLGQVLQIGPNSMVKRADFLERRGLVKRVVNERNRREWLLRLTPKAERLVQEYLQAIVELSRLTQDEIKSLTTLAMRVIQAEYDVKV